MSKKKLMATVAQFERFLTEQQISASGPGTICADIQKLIEFIGVGGIRSQSNQGNLPSSVLPDLNRQLSQPIDIALSRPLLRDFPNIAGPYVLLRVMDMVHVGHDRLSIHEPALAAWTALNPTEQYFALIEAWLLLAEDSVLGSTRQRDCQQLGRNLAFLAGLPSGRWKTFDELWHKYDYRGGFPTWNVQLQLRFGLIDVEPWPLEGRTQKDRGWLMRRGRRTPWGEAVAGTLIAFFEIEDSVDLCFIEQDEEAGFGSLQPAFQKHFPDWQKVYAPAAPSLGKGLCVFKVCLDPRYFDSSAWFRIVAPGDLSLHHLAQAILRAFQFDDDDHLYEFRYRDRLGKARCYNHPCCEEGPWADQISIGNTGLEKGQTMKFCFDFGDAWRFLVRLDRIQAPDASIRSSKVIESHGKPPKQYPDWDE